MKFEKNSFYILSILMGWVDYVCRKRNLVLLLTHRDTFFSSKKCCKNKKKVKKEKTNFRIYYLLSTY